MQKNKTKAGKQGKTEESREEQQRAGNIKNSYKYIIFIKLNNFIKIQTGLKPYILRAFSLM